MILGAREWTVERVAEVRDPATGELVECDAACFPLHSLVQIMGDMDTGAMGARIGHEMIHVLFEQSGKQIDSDLEEEIAQALGPELNNLICQNPAFIARWIAGRLFADD